MIKKKSKKRIFSIQVKVELQTEDREIVEREYRKRFSAVDLTALRQRLKLYRNSLYADLKSEFPESLLQKMDFLFKGNKILGKGQQRQRRAQKEEFHRELRQADRRIASGDFSVIP